MVLELLGPVFSLIEIFKKVRDQVRASKADRAFRERLENVLEPLDQYQESIKASERSGKALRAKVDNLKPPISVHEGVALATLLTDFSNDFANVISSVCMFSEECSHLLTPGFEGFMRQLMGREPDLYELLTFFGHNYNAKSNTLNLAALPTFLRAHSSKLKTGGKENDELSKEVAEGGKSVSRAIQVARGIKRQRPFRNVDKHVVKNYFRAVKNLGREGRRLKATKQTWAQLSRYSPSWLRALAEIIEIVQKEMSES